MKSAIKFLKYPGIKLILIRDIEKEFKESGCSIFIDVFGGSGSVSLNLSASKIIYNDIDPEVASIFSAVKNHSEEFYSELCVMTESKEDFMSYENKPVDWKNRKVKDACLSFYRHNTSFGGKGETYGTEEKGSFQFFMKIFTNYAIISKKIRTFTVENKDFRDIFREYDSVDSFFYVDPPYPGKNWYNYEFSNEDMKDLKNVLKNTKGSYLMNFNAEDDLPKQIFGNPQYVIKYDNRNSLPGTEYKYYSFYKRVKKS